MDAASRLAATQSRRRNPRHRRAKKRYAKRVSWNAFNLDFRIALIWKYSSAPGVAAALTWNLPLDTRLEIARCLGMSDQEKTSSDGAYITWGMQ
jgi:hypothetical protein